MKKDPRLKRQILRVALAVEQQGYRALMCRGDMAETFDLLADSIYGPELDSGILIRVQVNKVSKEALEAVLDYSLGGRKKKEIWLVCFLEAVPNDPGRAYIFRCLGDKVIEYPLGLDLSGIFPGKEHIPKTLSSKKNGQKRGVRSAKVEPKSAITGS